MSVPIITKIVPATEAKQPTFADVAMGEPFYIDGDVFRRVGDTGSRMLRTAGEHLVHLDARALVILLASVEIIATRRPA